MEVQPSGGWDREIYMKACDGGAFWDYFLDHMIYFVHRCCHGIVSLFFLGGGGIKWFDIIVWSAKTPQVVPW